MAKLKSESLKLDFTRRQELCQELLFSLSDETEMLTVFWEALGVTAHGERPALLDVRSEPSGPAPPSELEKMSSIVLGEDQLDILLEEHFEVAPFLVSMSLAGDSLKTDPFGRIFMSPVEACAEGLLSLEAAKAKGLWADFQEFEAAEDKFRSTFFGE